MYEMDIYIYIFDTHFYLSGSKEKDGNAKMTTKDDQQSNDIDSILKLKEAEMYVFFIFIIL